MSDSLWLHELQPPGFPVLHYLPEFAQTHAHWVSDAILSSSVAPFSSCPQYFPASGSFPMSLLFASSSQRTRASALLSVLPVNIQGWFPLGLTGLISLLCKGLSRVFSNTTVWKHWFFHAQLSLGPTLTSIHNYWKDHSFDQMDLCWQSDIPAFFNTLSRFVIAFLPRSKCLLIS